MKAIIFSLTLLTSTLAFAQDLIKEIPVGSCLNFNDALMIKKNWGRTLYNNGDEIEARPAVYGRWMSLCEVRGTSAIPRGQILKITHASERLLEASALDHEGEETQIQIKCDKSSLSSLLYNLGYKISLLAESESSCSYTEPVPTQIQKSQPFQEQKPQPQQRPLPRKSVHF